MKLMKRSLLPLLVCVLALGLASQAVAGPAATSRGQAFCPAGQSFSCLGGVTAVDPVAGTITVTVRHASVALRGSVGQSLTLTVTGDSAIATLAHRVRTAVSLADVPTGDLLATSGTIDASDPAAPVYTVVKAVVWPPAAHARFLCVGTVSSVDPQANALVVHVRHGSVGLRGSLGKDVTIDLASSTKIFVAREHRFGTATSSDITAGDRVVIHGQADRSNPGSPVFTASRVLVRHVVAVGALKWFACVGQISSADQTASTITITVKRGTRAVHAAIGGDLTLAVTASSVVRTLSDGAVATVALADVQAGESIFVVGSIDHSDPTTPVYDIGHAFVWQPVTHS
jgi:hypothetical protein